MSKRFLISEDERNSILSLYEKKGIILEQKDKPRVNVFNRKQTDDGSSNDKIFFTPSFSVGSFGILVKDNNLTVMYNSEGGVNYRRIEPVNIGGNHKNFTVDLNKKQITNSDFIKNQEEVSEWGGFASVKKDDRPSITDVGFQVVMINFPTSEANYELPRFQPNLCTVVIHVDKIDVLNNTEHHPRTLSDSSTIGLTEYYIPKSKREWYFLREKIDSMYVNGKDATKISFRKFKRDNMGIYLKDYWPRNAFGGSTVPPPRLPINIAINLDIENPFIFDTTELEGDGNRDLKKFIDDVKKQKEIHGEEIYNDFINFLNNINGGILVTTSASIDEDPNGDTADSDNPNTTTFPGCRESGGITRKLYNQCLSKKRAEVILQKLNTDLPEITNFKANPIGETNQFDKNGKWPDVKGTKEQRSAQTVKNRRLVINLPTYTKN